jgi:hypothetical protein
VSTLTGEVAAKGDVCPTCGLAVGGWAIGATRAGRRTWDRPPERGGFTHVEGGERCKPSALVVASVADEPGDLGPSHSAGIAGARAALTLARVGAA